MTKKIGSLLFVLALTAEAFALQGTLRTESEQISGDIRWDDAAKEYLISRKRGNALVKMRRRRADVIGLEIPEPPALARARQQVEDGQGLRAIGTLEKIASDYHMLRWDAEANRLLVKAYLLADDPQRALKTCLIFIRNTPESAYTGELAPLFWESLRLLGKRSTLDGLLRKAVSEGDRPSAAAALVLRGDLILSDGEKDQETARRALVEAYRKVTLFFTTSDCRDSFLAALNKSADCYALLGEHKKAEALRALARNPPPAPDEKSF